MESAAPFPPTGLIFATIDTSPGPLLIPGTVRVLLGLSYEQWLYRRSRPWWKATWPKKQNPWRLEDVEDLVGELYRNRLLTAQGTRNALTILVLIARQHGYPI